MRLKLVCNGLEGFNGTSLVNSETGEELCGVTNVRFKHSPDDFPRLSFEIIDGDIEIDLDACLPFSRED